MNQRAMRIRGLIVTLIAGMIVMSLPSISFAGDTKLIDDARTDSACPTCNYGNDSNLNVQQPSQKSYIKFDLSTLPAGTVGSNVAKATFRLWVNTVTTAGSFDIYNVTSAWTEEAITHNGAPTLGGLEVTAVSVTTASVRKFVTVDLTALVKDWLNGVLVNNGIALIGNAAGTNISFDSKENQGHSHEPRLEIELAKPEGDITAVFAGTGLTGGGTIGDVTLSIASSYQLPQTCANGQVAKWNGTAWACASDNDSGGDITAVNAGTGLSGGGTSGDVTLSIASSYQLPQLCTIGQVAKSNGAGGWTCANDIDTIGIGGSGTTNFVPKFTASTTLGNSSIFETGGNVGIGTTVPTAALHVGGGSGSNTTLIVDSTTTNGPAIRLNKNSINRGFFGLEGVYLGNTSTHTVVSTAGQVGDELRFYTGGAGTPRMTIAEGGNVGIGTANPGAKLAVVKAADTNANPFVAPFLTLLSNTVGITAGDKVAIAFRANNDNSTMANIRAEAETTGSESSKLVFATTDNIAGSRDWLTITSAGKVGIGTTPNAQLQVTGGDVAVTTQGSGVILRANDGGTNCYRLTVNNVGTLSTAPVTCP